MLFCAENRKRPEESIPVHIIFRCGASVEVSNYFFCSIACSQLYQHLNSVKSLLYRNFSGSFKHFMDLLPALTNALGTGTDAPPTSAHKNAKVRL